MFWVLRHSGYGRSGAHRGGREGWRQASGQAQPRLLVWVCVYTDTAATVANVSPFGAALPLSPWVVH